MNQYTENMRDGIILSVCTRYNMPKVQFDILIVIMVIKSIIYNCNLLTYECWRSQHLLSGVLHCVKVIIIL